MASCSRSCSIVTALLSNASNITFPTCHKRLVVIMGLVTLFLLSSNVVHSQSVSPTFYNSTHSVFQTNSTNLFKEKTVLCNTNYCTIICDYSTGYPDYVYGCQSMHIIANQSTSIDIQCTADDVCRDTIIDTTNALHISIWCSGDNSCFRSTSSIIDSSNVNFACDWNGCFDVKLTVNNITRFEIACSDDGSCSHTNISLSNAVSFLANCTGDASCENWQAQITNTSQVNMTCGGTIQSDDLNCGGSSLHFIETEYVHIECLGDRSCDQTTINATRSPTVQIDCIGDGESCYEALIIFSDDASSYDLSTIIPRLTVSCNGTKACYYTDVYCRTEENGICDIRCLSDAACIPIDVYIARGSRDSLHTQFSDTVENVIHRCDIDDPLECVTIYPDNAVLSCTANEHCQMNCQSHNCSFLRLDASKALSLSTICEEEDSCAYTTFLCPTGNEASCSISCEAYKACQFADVVVKSDRDATSHDEVRVDCSYENSCWASRITIDVVDISQIVFNCSYLTACHEIETSIDAENVDNIIIFCLGESACDETIWTSSVENLDGVVIECNGYRACESSYFDFADSANFKMECDDRACIHNRIFCPYREESSCNIYVYDYGAGIQIITYLYIIVPEDYEYGYLNLQRGDAITDVTVQCYPDHKNTETAVLEYNQTSLEFYCDEMEASICCPYGERYKYQSNEHNSSESDFDYNLIDLNLYIPDTFDNDTKWITSSETVQLIDQIIACDKINCIFECIEILSCALSTIYINGTDQNTVLVSCSSSFSCLGATILDEPQSPDRQITVICSGTDSCNELTVNLTEFDSFNLYCVESGSCQEVTVNLDIDLSDDIPTDYGIIHCVLSSVCDDLRFNTNSERSQLMMYEFSRGIVLNNGIGYLSAIDNIECNQNRWIQFDGDLESDSTVIQSVNNEYDDDQLPCDGVEVQCGNRSCIMNYQYIGNDTVETLNNGSDTAYSVHIDDLYLITCNGECEQSPTESPTNAPSAAPSASPSPAPSYSPTDSPSHAPTSADDYDHYVLAQFIMGNLTDSKRTDIVDSIESFIGNITYSITTGFDDDDVLEFQDIWLNISEINHFDIKYLIRNKEDIKYKLDGANLMLKSYILCEEIVCDHIASYDDSDTESLRSFVESEIQNQYGSGLNFSVNSLLGPYNLNPSPSPFDYTKWIPIIIAALIVIVSGFAFLFNEGVLCVIPPCHTVDNGKWPALISLATQFNDLASDALWTIDVWMVCSALSGGGTNQKLKVFISAIGSTVFLVIPYFVNLYSATKVKRKGGAVSRNNAAQIWFNSYSLIFIGFTMVTGSTYTAMQVVSSNVFGINQLNCGLTQFELRQVFHLKVVNNVFLQEVPQICFILLFQQAMGEMTDFAIYSIISSILSVLCTSLQYLIDRDRGDNLLAAEYHLVIKCDRQKTPIPLSGLKKDSNSGNELSKTEEAKIEKHRGKTLSLSKEMAKICHSQPKSFEIGCTVLTKQGAVIHVVQYLDQNKMESHMTLKSYVRRQFASLKSEITKLIQDHFELGTDFKVSFVDTVQGNDYMERKGEFDDDDEWKMEDLLVRYLSFGTGSVDDKKRKIDTLMQMADSEDQPLLYQSQESVKSPKQRKDFMPLQEECSDTSDCEEAAE